MNKITDIEKTIEMINQKIELVEKKLEYNVLEIKRMIFDNCNNINMLREMMIKK